MTQVGRATAATQNRASGSAFGAAAGDQRTPNAAAIRASMPDLEAWYDAALAAIRSHLYECEKNVRP